MTVPFLLLLSLAAAAPAAADWREFDRRQRGWDETPAQYDSGRVRRRGGKVRAWIRYEVRLSGLPDLRRTERLELDCATGRGRPIEAIDEGGVHAFNGRARHTRLRGRLAPIAAGSLEEALARKLCPAGNAAR